MKKFNKIIAVLIVISILSSFAVCASAAVGDSVDMQLRFTDTDGNQITSAASGDIIDVYFAINTAGQYVKILQADVMYDVNYVKQTRATATKYQKPTASNSCELLGDMADAEDTLIEDPEDPIYAATAEKHPAFEDDWAYYALSGTGTFKVTPHAASFFPSSWTDEQQAQYNLVRITYKTNGGSAHVGIYSNEGEYVDLARFRFVAQADIESLDSSIINWCADQENNGMTGTSDNEPLSVYMSNTTSLTMTYSIAEASAPTYLVNPVKNQIQWNNKDENSVNIGVVAGFSADDIKINFVNGVSDNVTKIGTIYKINGEVQSPELTTNRVYSVNGGESYNFRIVLGNISTETTDTYSVIPYVVYNGETVYGPEIKITPDDVTTLVDRLS